MIELEAALMVPVGADGAAWWSKLLIPLTGLQEAFRRHVAVTEANGGLLEEIVDYAPRLAHARDRLVHDHVEITTVIDCLCSPAPPEGPEDAREAARHLLGLLSSHRHRGSDFVYEAYNFDMGGGD
jgi:hypothetical protein